MEKSLGEKYKLSLLLEIACLSKQAYYYGLKNMCYKANKDKIYEELIVKIFNKNYQKYGIRRMTDAINIELSKQELPNINHKRVERIMKKIGIQARPKQRKHISYKGDFGKKCKNFYLKRIY